MLHSVLGAYTCYRPDVGYVSELSIFYPVLRFTKKVRTVPVMPGLLAAEGEANALFSVGHGQSHGSELPASPKGIGRHSGPVASPHCNPIWFSFSACGFSAFSEEKPLAATI